VTLTDPADQETTVADPARTPDERKHDALKQLDTEVDAWVSTASTDGTPYLVPLSFLWDDGTLWLSTAANNPTSRNLKASGQLHLAIGQTRDVLLITGTATPAVPSDDLADAFATKCGFDPRLSNYPYFQVTPHQIQAWREVNELPNRTLMQNATWLI
jgi:hypothetical protein